MAGHNADVAACFNRLADLLEIEGANPFRVRAYRRAAQSIGDLPGDIAALAAEPARLTRLPGIGADLAAKIREVVDTGRLQALDEVEARTPSTLAALASLPGLGPKRVHALHEALGVRTLDELLAAAQAGRVRRLPHFGAATEQRIIAEIRKHRQSERRFRLATVEAIAGEIVEHLQAAPGIGHIVVAGSVRRRRETVGDLDILATASDGAAVIDRFTGYEAVEQVLSQGTTRSTVILACGLQVDLRVVAEASYGAALHYFTGSRAHSIAIRTLAQARGLKLNEYGIFRGEAAIGGRTEQEVFEAAGLPYIEPELRENRGEIEAAQAGRLPRLVTLDDISGDLHAHTAASDGANSLAEMAEAARALGYAYLAISDHSQHASIARGLDRARLAAQLDDIDRLNDRLDGLRLLKACEVDILADGTLDLPGSILKRLDLRICAVHQRFDLDRTQQTERILRAMDNRLFNILAHPTGRLLGDRPGYQVDLPRILEGAKARGCFVEVNAHPSRLDLDEVHCRIAKELGVKLAISSDAHSAAGLGLMRYGVDQARRGWIEPADVLNARPWAELKGLLAR